MEVFPLSTLNTFISFHLSDLKRIYNETLSKLQFLENVLPFNGLLFSVLQSA